ncbi:RNase P modulator RnpM [Salsuginibacillus kocurii]|uniref:RNase P modulator RnpM n=1 Tax=Salsuginibacillus kocurii TaxID=427078 RepID=UPI000370DB2B|nr:YlxR family protein [Salsuginibacillus kocurii]
MKKKKIPLRKCIVTNEMKQKSELIRVVRSPEGDIFLDPTGKKNGRGAYLSNNEEVFLAAQKKDLLSRHLKVNVTEEDYLRLMKEREELITK